ncbi:right-handed parallel beta-helix repeat-containing protein, partial [Candidatus Bathyarchaeota archaeon]|nr:right-handed parallel beta-helix repeat-containing protein [Candidatus Bathyarchaeota archaeon]
MRRKSVFGIMLVLLLMGILTLAFNIQPVRASDGTIYVRADGSIDPSDAPIRTDDNVTYTFADSIYDEIVVERSNVIIDGAGYTVQGAWTGSGISLSGITNVTVKNTNIKNFGYGIYLDSSSNNSISGNNVTSNNDDGIRLSSSSNNSITGNNVRANNWQGIRLIASSNNSISGNNVTSNNCYCIIIDGSSGNSIYHNNFIDNTKQVHNYGSTNAWDDGYPSGGNYWSDYTDADQYSGPYQ